jgi:hypothetical protein
MLRNEFCLLFIDQWVTGVEVFHWIGVLWMRFGRALVETIRRVMGRDLLRPATTMRAEPMVSVWPPLGFSIDIHK